MTLSTIKKQSYLVKKKKEYWWNEFLFKNTQKQLYSEA